MGSIFSKPRTPSLPPPPRPVMSKTDTVGSDAEGQRTAEIRRRRRQRGYARTKVALNADTQTGPGGGKTTLG